MIRSLPLASAAGVALSPDGSWAAGAGGIFAPDQLTVLNMQTLNVRVIAVGKFPDLGFSRDGKLLAAISMEGEGRATLHLWDPATGKQVVRLPRWTRGTRWPTFSPGGQLLATNQYGPTHVFAVSDLFNAPAAKKN
jgi:WD40 repeat protein